MTHYDLTLAKEVTRECAWGVMGLISRVEQKIGKSPILELIERKIGEELREIPGMSFEEIKILDAKCSFIMNILSELEAR